MLLGVLLASRPAVAGGAKYFFKLSEVTAPAGVDQAVKTSAAEALEADLKGRAEFTSDIADTGDEAALAAEIKKRGLRGFKIALKIERLDHEVKDPKPGSRLKRVDVKVKVSVFGTTLPGDKLSFSGDGELGMESEASEKSLDREIAGLSKDATKEAIKQAVDQAVAKLSIPKSAPMNEGRHKGKAKKK